MYMYQLDINNQELVAFILEIPVGHNIYLCLYTIFDLITAPVLITAPLTFYYIFTYHRPLGNLLPDFLLYFQLLSST